MAEIRSFTDLETWQEGHKLVVLIYKLTQSLPAEEKFSLGDQMRRAAVSVTSNVAEGFGRYGGAEKKHFYSIAEASISELQNQLLVCRDVGYLAPAAIEPILQQATVALKLLRGLRRSIR